MGWIGAAVLSKGDEAVRVHGLGDRHAARDRADVRLAGGVRIRALVRGVDGAALHACHLEHIGEADSGPFRAGDGTVSPLHALSRRVEEGAAVAGALQRERCGDDIEPAL